MYEKTLKISGWLAQALVRLKAHSDAPRLDAECLLSAVLERPRAWLIAHADTELTEAEIQQLNQWISLREQQVPLAYILGEQEFWSLTLRVNRDTLIPRPETECMVERALALLDTLSAPRIADLGTGSGAIAVALATERPDAIIVATDQSEAALAVARHNAVETNATNVSFRQGDWCEPLGGDCFDMIITNPPYVESDFPGLTTDLRHEPVSALASGEDGLDDIRRIAETVGPHLKQGGAVLIEHGHMHADAVSGILRAQSFIAVRTHRDLSNTPRFTEARLATA